MNTTSAEIWLDKFPQINRLFLYCNTFSQLQTLAKHVMGIHMNAPHHILNRNNYIVEGTNQHLVWILRMN